MLGPLLIFSDHILYPIIFLIIATWVLYIGLVHVAAPLLSFRLNYIYLHMSQADLSIRGVTFYTINVNSWHTEP